jgi:hypothetical protein
MMSPLTIYFRAMTCRDRSIARIVSSARVLVLVLLWILMPRETAASSTSLSRSRLALMGMARSDRAPRHRIGFLQRHQSPLNYGQTNQVGTGKMLGSLVEVEGQIACLPIYEPPQKG